MKKEVKILRGKAIDSLVLSIELFNRPSEAGRAHGVLIFLDHAFEMLFKAIILHRGGRTIGFDASVRKGLSDAKVKFLTDHQALTVQMINSLRDAAQHHILDISEGHLYIHAQAGLSLFRDLFVCPATQSGLHQPAWTTPPSCYGGGPRGECRAPDADARSETKVVWRLH
jgi:hypothetical protein